MWADQRVTVLIPALDEEGNIGRVVGALPRDVVDEVVVVDNLSNSKEESLRRVRQLTGGELEFHQVDLLDRPGLDRDGRRDAERRGHPHP